MGLSLVSLLTNPWNRLFVSAVTEGLKFLSCDVSLITSIHLKGIIIIIRPPTKQEYDPQVTFMHIINYLNQESCL